MGGSTEDSFCVNCVTQSQGLSKLRLFSLKPCFLLPFASGGAIHIDYNENDTPGVEPSNVALLLPPKLGPAGCLWISITRSLPLSIPDDTRKTDRNKGPLEGTAFFALLQAGSSKVH